MKKSTIKMLSIGLCGTLAVGGAVQTIAAASSNDILTPETPSPEPSPNAAAQSETQAPVSKDETVYVLTGADGSVEKVIVSDWLQNSMNQDTIIDRSHLNNVQNVKGLETFSADGDSRSWNANGNDIYSQGISEEALPVDMSICYTLDGSPISPEELAGKSGKVTIQFNFVNNQYEMVEIDGKQEKIYVPFVMLTSLILDNENFRNVDVSHGKVYNDGDRTVVLGYAMPGLQESLDLDSEKLELPDCIEITADVTDFELETTMTLATANLFDELDLDDMDDLDNLGDSLDELTDAMAQLIDGSSQLADGLDTLLERSGELVSGVNQLSAGAKSVKEGADSLDAGASQLKEGAGALNTGLSALTDNNDTLNGGAQQIFSSLLASADAQLAASGLTLPPLTPDNYSQVLDGVIASLPEDASASVVQLKGSLDAYQSFYTGLQNYTAGVAEAAAGASSLSQGADALQAGTAQLSAGAAQLRDGLDSLQKNTPALTDGVTQLRDGADELHDGLIEFDQKGVQKLVDAVDGNLDHLVERMRATVDASRNYQSYSGLSDDMDGQVKFVYRTDGI